MKIRILNNSLRLRLSTTEVATLAKDHEVDASIHFSPTSYLTYAIKASDEPTISAQYESHQITVFIPKATISDWANSDLISLSAEMEIDEKEHLHILVEKDFKCLSTDRKEDESDLFPNPKSDTIVC